MGKRPLGPNFAIANDDFIRHAAKEREPIVAREFFRQHQDRERHEDDDQDFAELQEFIEVPHENAEEEMNDHVVEHVAAAKYDRGPQRLMKNAATDGPDTPGGHEFVDRLPTARHPLAFDRNPNPTYQGDDANDREVQARHIDLLA